MKILDIFPGSKSKILDLKKESLWIYVPYGCLIFIEFEHG